MCARGGKGGVVTAPTGTSMYCCFRAGGFCLLIQVLTAVQFVTHVQDNDAIAYGVI